MMSLITLQVLLEVFFFQIYLLEDFFCPSHTLEAGEVVPEKRTRARTEATSNNINVHCVMALLNMSPALL